MADPTRAYTSQANETCCPRCGYVFADRGHGLTADYWHHMGVAHDVGPGVEPDVDPMLSEEST